ncbi:MAG: chorismate-binding protein [Desulfamplus sp.]|nr:chorismate-binding protein [Desulfamplus sp.]
MILKQYPSKEDFKELALKYNVIPVCAEILADTETPVSILQKFYSSDKAEDLSSKVAVRSTSENGMFLLESVEGGEHWARYSFMGLSAKSHVKVFKDNIVIQERYDIKNIPHKGDPIASLKEITSLYKPADIKALPRFWSGLTGYFTYEMVSFFEDIPSMLSDDKPYAHFIIPDAMIIFDNMNHTLTCMSICYINDKDDNIEADSDTLSSKDIDSYYQESCTHLEQIIDRISRPIENKISRPVSSKPESDTFLLTPETEHDTYTKGVERIKEHIVAGDIIQAVYSQPFSSDKPVDPVMLYRAQRYINPSPYMFFMNLGDIAIAGSSPETMVRLENRTATLRPIAGTRPRGKNEQEDRALADELLNDEKERAEHLMLVDLGRNDLGRVAEVGTVQVTDLMFVERYSHVMHLVSNINCEVKREFDAWDLLRATFPAGTLSGAPKIRAMEIISDMERRPRKIYGGAAGYISFSGNMDLAITIRTATVENGRMTVQAGAGIVADSDPEREYQECVNKARSVERALKLALMNSNNSSTGQNNIGISCNNSLNVIGGE